YSGGARIAYFSMEFGIHESLPLFAGGLGVLAGDHLKSASHMGLPMVAVGLLYRQGYFRQLLDPNGWQQETYPETDLYTLPLTRVKNGKADLRISAPHPDGEMLADVWKIMIGRVPLFLLDTNVLENPPAIREVTARLYNSEPGVRLAQEVLLGIGGMRALEAMGIESTICHMNEGHSSFANVERLAQVMERNRLDIPTAMEVVARTSVFTTHTPVPAGHDEFPIDQVRPYIKPLARQLRATEDEVLAWGCTGNSKTPHGPFSMLILGLRFSQHCNGVSRLHGNVARRMWRHVWPEHNDDDVPITHVTNGVHISSFIAPEIVLLFERYLGPEWHYSSRKSENIERIDEIYDEELWRSHEMSRTRLISKVRELLVKQYARRNAPIAVVRAAENALDPERLTLGFARRFATYKRANLILRDPERLKAMLTDKQRPVQIIFAGKAHPQDNEGKDLIRNIIQFARHHDVRNQIVFIEDYDMGIARHLVQGVDVWLNTPRRPLEACGTSGMKAALNGALNLSILDGWWDEGYTPERGWSIGSGEEYPDPAYQDAVEAQALYNVLENDVIPCFYNRTSGNMPGDWLSKMKASMKMAMAQFCSHRMVNEYQQRFYLPGVQRYRELLADNAVEAQRLSVLHQRLKELWRDVRVEMPERDHEGPFQVEDSFTVSAIVHLGDLKPEEVDVELYYGRMQRTNELEKGFTQEMEVVQERGNGTYQYRCTVRCKDSGRFGFTVRVVPRADDWILYSPGLLTWA
ncbi:MAG: alpha-glucan family phosphorylase, partial [Desulfatitalea sp.]|nr:alpha-glucan family phosphorylase [Desulfatitalea sp.]